MGRLIDTDKLKDIIEYCILANVPADAENTMEEKWNDWFQTVIDRVQPVEAIPKDQYEARLKADMVAMLEDIYSWRVRIQKARENLSGREFKIEDYDNIIQSKIDELKGVKDGNAD